MPHCALLAHYEPPKSLDLEGRQYHHLTPQSGVVKQEVQRPIWGSEAPWAPTPADVLLLKRDMIAIDSRGAPRFLRTTQQAVHGRKVVEGKVELVDGQVRMKKVEEGVDGWNKKEKCKVFRHRFSSAIGQL